ncbi:MAG: PPOX class F420-dependent enzyme [Deltaproteobacteria bacterium RIFCSPLOWO2_12_FULL_60_19]|nr:MAG: PPOX class F420-dependent enzyme [Deltaproteobacteria bacterium RIFCSPLOWO2_12_FULL_60_19]
MDIAEAQRFLSQHHHGALVTRRRDGSLQMSLVSPAVDNTGLAIISTRETAYKTKNIRRDPRVSLCVFTEAFHGSKWVQLNGRAEIVSLPQAMEPLIDWHRRVKGEHPNWAAYRQTMEKERRVLLRIAIESVGPQRRG